MKSTLYQNEPEKPTRGEPRPVAAGFCQIKDKCCLVCSESYDLYVWLGHIWGAYTNLNFDLEGLVLAFSIKHIPGNNSCRVSVVCGTGKRSVIFWFKEIFLTLYQA